MEGQKVLREKRDHMIAEGPDMTKLKRILRVIKELRQMLRHGSLI